MCRFWWLALGALLVVAGVTVVIASNRWGEASFGWFAYSPLSESALNIEDQLSRGVREFWAGIALALVGSVVIAGGVGYRLGLRGGPAGREG
jgi:heme/copper-type cytochrome/quinol oxidase subunit 1